MVYTRAFAPTYLSWVFGSLLCLYILLYVYISVLWLVFSPKFFSQMNFFFWALTLFNFQGSSSARFLSELVYYTSLRSVCQHFFSTFFSFFRAALLFTASAVQRMLYYHLFILLSTPFSPFFAFLYLFSVLYNLYTCRIYNERVQKLHEKNKRGACFKQAEIKRVSALTLGLCARNLIWIMPT